MHWQFDPTDLLNFLKAPPHILRALLPSGGLAAVGIVTMQGQKYRDEMILGLSAVLVLTALYLILSKGYDAADRHWAYGIIGLVTGYWLGPHAGGRQPHRQHRPNKGKEPPEEAP